MTQIAKPPVVMFTELMQHFATQADAARAYGVSRSAVQSWKKQGKVPSLRAMQLVNLAPTVSGVNAVGNNANVVGVTASCQE